MLLLLRGFRGMEKFLAFHITMLLLLLFYLLTLFVRSFFAGDKGTKACKANDETE